MRLKFENEAQLAGSFPDEPIARLQLAASVPLLLANLEHADLYVNVHNPIAAMPCKCLNWTIVSIRKLIGAVHVNMVHGDTPGLPGERHRLQVRFAVWNLKPRYGI